MISFIDTSVILSRMALHMDQLLHPSMDEQGHLTLHFDILLNMYWESECSNLMHAILS